MVEVAEQVSGLALERRLLDWTEGTRDPEFAALLAPFGIQHAARPAVDAPHFALLGAKTVTVGRRTAGLRTCSTVRRRSAPGCPPTTS